MRKTIREAIETATPESAAICNLRGEVEHLRHRLEVKESEAHRYEVALKAYTSCKHGCIDCNCTHIAKATLYRAGGC